MQNIDVEVMQIDQDVWRAIGVGTSWENMWARGATKKEVIENFRKEYKDIPSRLFPEAEGFLFSFVELQEVF